jgi:hypothetical protein
LRKLLWTTLISLVVFALGTLVYEYRLIAFDDFATWIGIKG